MSPASKARPNGDPRRASVLQRWPQAGGAPERYKSSLFDSIRSLILVCPRMDLVLQRGSDCLCVNAGRSSAAIGACPSARKRREAGARRLLARFASAADLQWPPWPASPAGSHRPVWLRGSRSGVPEVSADSSSAVSFVRRSHRRRGGGMARLRVAPLSPRQRPGCPPRAGSLWARCISQLRAAGSPHRGCPFRAFLLMVVPTDPVHRLYAGPPEASMSPWSSMPRHLFLWRTSTPPAVLAARRVTAPARPVIFLEAPRGAARRRRAGSL